MTPAAEDIARLSREIALVCDASGTVLWADERASRTIDARVGSSLAELCVTGTGDKAGELVSRAVHDPVDGWELSFPDHGGTFTVTFNARPYGESALLVGHVAPPIYRTAIEGMVEDDRRTLFVYERYLAMAGFQVIPARTVDAARQALARELPVAIVLDVVLEEENTWSFLSELKRDPRTQHAQDLRDDVALLLVVVDVQHRAWPGGVEVSHHSWVSAPLFRSASRIRLIASSRERFCFEITASASSSRRS